MGTLLGFWEAKTSKTSELGKQGRKRVCWASPCATDKGQRSLQNLGMHQLHVTVLQARKRNATIDNTKMSEETVAMSATKVNDILACNQLEGVGGS